MKKFKLDLVVKLKNGKISVRNDGDIQDLKDLLKYCCYNDTAVIYKAYTYFWIYKDAWILGHNNLPEVSINDFIEEEFMLPKMCCVKITKENKETFRNNNIESMPYVDGVIERYFCTNDYKFIYHSPDIYGTEITFEQFKKYILKQEIMEKKIIGYKLKKEVYYINGREKYFYNGIVNIGFIHDVNDFNAENINKSIKNLNDGHEVIKNFKAAGVLDLWFEPIYELKEQIYYFGQFKVTIKKEGIFHKNERITNFVEEICNKFVLNTYLNAFNHNYVLSSIKFSKTGCENHETDLTQWKEVLDIYNKMIN